MKDTTSTDSDPRIDRRKILAGVAGAGTMALAGCTGEQDNGGDSDGTPTQSNQSTPEGSLPAPPEPPEEPPENDYWKYLMASVEWQNEALREIERNS